MLILITKDGATVVPKEVGDLSAAKLFEDQGFTVHVETEAGRVPLADVVRLQEHVEMERAAQEGRGDGEVGGSSGASQQTDSSVESRPSIAATE